PVPQRTGGLVRTVRHRGGTDRRPARGGLGRPGRVRHRAARPALARPGAHHRVLVRPRTHDAVLRARAAAQGHPGRGHPALAEPQRAVRDRAVGALPAGPDPGLRGRPGRQLRAGRAAADDPGAVMGKPTLAVWKFASCDGCQLTLLDCEDELLALADTVTI